MEKALNEVSELVKIFLLKNGGNESGFKTTINGTIYLDNINIGDTSALSFHTPSTFLLKQETYDNYVKMLITSIKGSLVKHSLQECRLITKSDGDKILGHFKIFVKLYKEDVWRII